MYLAPILEYFDVDYYNAACTVFECPLDNMGQALYVVHDGEGDLINFVCSACYDRIIEDDERLKADDPYGFVERYGPDEA